MAFKSERSVRRTFRVLFILLPLAAIGITEGIWTMRKDYIHKTSPLYLDIRTLADSNVTSGEYVVINDWCMGDNYAEITEDKKDVYYYIVNSCDSPNTGYPSVVMKLDKDQHEQMEKTDFSSIFETVSLFEGKLVRGFDGESASQLFIERQMKTDLDNSWTLYSGVTPASAKKGFQGTCILILVLTLLAAGLLLALRWLSLRNVRNAAARRNFFLEQMRKAGNNPS